MEKVPFVYPLSTLFLTVDKLSKFFIDVYSFLIPMLHIKNIVFHRCFNVGILIAKQKPESEYSSMAERPNLREAPVRVRVFRLIPAFLLFENACRNLVDGCFLLVISGVL